MATTLISTLHSGIEIAFLVALLSVSLRGSGRAGLLSRLKWGAAFALVVSSVLTYGVVSGWSRETVELAANGLAVLLALSLIVWLGRTSRSASREPDSKAGPGSFLLFLATAALVALPALNIELTHTRIFLGLDRPNITDQVTTVVTPLLVLAPAALAGIILHKVAAQARPAWITTAVILALSVLLARDLIVVLQIMLVKGMLPLTDWLFRLIVPLVNSPAIIFYIFLAAVIALVLSAVWEWQRRKYSYSLSGLNPAQKRKTRSIARRTATLFSTFGLLLLSVVTADRASAFLANHPPQLSPATPVSAEGGQVRIPEDSLADGLLHRFSFATGDNIQVRFLVVYKGSGIYGAGLDACDFCGVAGYRQDKDNIICNRCGAAISKTTIGFPGGCNPIPLPGKTEGNFVTISVEDLEAKRVVFEQ